MTGAGIIFLGYAIWILGIAFEFYLEFDWEKRKKYGGIGCFFPSVIFIVLFIYGSSRIENEIPMSDNVVNDSVEIAKSYSRSGDDSLTILLSRVLSDDTLTQEEYDEFRLKHNRLEQKKTKDNILEFKYGDIK